MNLLSRNYLAHSHNNINTLTRKLKIAFFGREKVLVLLPTDDFKLLMHWKGTFVILERVHGNDYRIQSTDKTRLFHANLLKKSTNA